MKNIWPVCFGLSVILAAAIGLAGCGTLSNPSPVNTNTAPATLAYVFGVESGQMVMTEYSTVSANNGSPVGSLQAGQGSIATDSAGQIYILYPNSNGAIPGGEIVVYPPNSTGNASPSRTIQLAYLPNRLAVDPTGRIYVANLPADWTNGAPVTISVYAADASRAATPLRTFVMTTALPPTIDMVADAAGNLYVAACLRGNQWAVAVYPPTANGPATPARTIDFAADTFVYGVAVDSAGKIFVNVGSVNNPRPTFIEEFAPGASGPATPINTINLTGGPSWQTVAGGPVRVDGAGNIFTSLQLLEISPETGQVVNVFYGFGPEATGNAVPTAQFAPPDGGANGWLALN
jgi:sugar lactone lactonase YvrE